MTGQFSLPRRFRQSREALPLLGEVPSAHTGERGLRSGIRGGGKRQNAVRTIFSYWHSLSHGDPSVSLTLDSSPKRGAKGGDGKTLAPHGAAPLRGSPQCAHWGKGSPEWDTVQTGKDRTQCRHFFSLSAVSLPRRPLSHFVTAPLRGAPRA